MEKVGFFFMNIICPMKDHPLRDIFHLDTGNETPNSFLVEGIALEPNSTSSNWFNKLDIECKLYVSLYQANS